MREALTYQQEVVLRKLAQVLPFYSQHCLKIVDKAGLIRPLVLNKAQMYIHEKVEEQKRRTGMVRAVILKGRQQGCLDPNTRILTSDLQWRRIKEIGVGQRLVACDENSVGLGRGQHRKMRTAIVEKKWYTRKIAYRITLDDGRSVVCSGDHKWLTRKSGVDPSWRSVNGKTPDRRDALKQGDLIRAITKTWGEPSFDDAWFGGMVDGEGSFDYKNRTGADLSISQIDGLILERMKKHCVTQGYGGCVVSDDGPRRSKFGLRSVHAISIGEAASLFRLFGLSRPTRFIGQEWWVGKKLPQNCWHRVEKIEMLGERRLVDIQTSTGTYIAEGLVTHNCTTYIQARFFHRTNFTGNLSAYVLAHQVESTIKIFSMTQKFRMNLPTDLQQPLEKDTERAMSMSNGSGYSVGTAGSAQIGRGMTVQLFHGSEVAFYENADQLSTGLMQTVADVVGTELIFESTANGPGNFFYDLVMGAIAGTNGFMLIFIPWYWQDEYKDPMPLAEKDLDEKEQKYWEAHKNDGLTLQHLAWRRRKIASFGGQEWKFVQEYPFNPEEAFVKAEGRFFDLARVYVARGKKVEPDPTAPLIIGIDQGRTGDWTSIARRTGKILHPFERIPADDGAERDMRLAGRIAKIIEIENPDLVVLDVTNEHGAMDRLHELGYSKRLVKGVHFGERAIDPTRHRNMRVQMHCDFREWFLDPDVSIPDDGKFLAQVGAIPQEKESSNNVLYLVPKDDVIKLLKFSPNDLEAAIITFAYPVRKKIPLDKLPKSGSVESTMNFKSTLRSFRR